LALGVLLVRSQFIRMAFCLGPSGATPGPAGSLQCLDFDPIDISSVRIDTAMVQQSLQWIGSFAPVTSDSVVQAQFAQIDLARVMN